VKDLKKWEKKGKTQKQNLVTLGGISRSRGRKKTRGEGEGIEKGNWVAGGLPFIRKSDL